MAALEGAWAKALNAEFHKEYYRKLYAFVKEEYANALPYLQSAVSAYPFLAGQINYCNLHR